MNWLKWAAVIYLTLAGRIVLGSSLDGMTMCPDAVIVLCVLALATIDHPLSYFVAGTIGFLGDVLWGERLGATLLCVLLVGRSLGGIRRWFDVGNPFRSIFVAGFLAAVILFSRAVLLRFLHHQSMTWEAMTMRALVDGLVDGTAVVLAAYLLEGTGRRLESLFQPTGS